MTPAELNIAIRAYADRRKADAKESTYQAYLISRWVWAKRVNIQKMLDDIDKGGREKKTMTDSEMLEKVKALNAMLGGTVKTS